MGATVNPRRYQWPVLAWIRLRLPEGMGSGPTASSRAAPSPPLETLRREPVVTDPRKRIFVQETAHGAGILRILWDADSPGILEAEWREPQRRKVSREELRMFWERTRELLTPVGPLPVEAADPR